MSWTRPSVWMTAVVAVLMCPVVAQSQTEPTEPTQLDVGGLLDTASLQPAGIADDAWSLRPQGGFKLIALPVTLSPVDETIELSDPSFSLRGGGRFLCWRIPAPGTDTGTGAAAPQFGPSQFGPFGPGQFDPGMDFGPPGAMGPGGPMGPMGPMPQPNAAPDQTVPQGAPRIARKITLTPEGTVQWELDSPLARSPNAQPNNNSLFALKVRSDLLRAMEPQRPGTGATPAPRPIAGGGDEFGPPVQRTAPSAPPGGGAADQRRAAELAYREQIEAFRDLRNQINDLPDTFEESAPPRVWAVYEVRAEVDELSFNGPDPMPWRIGLAGLETLSTMANQGGRRQPGQLDAQTTNSIIQLNQLAGDNHPLTHRLIATVVQRSNLAAAAAPGDVVYRLITQLLASPDVEARRVALEALAAVNPPTPASITLLRDAILTLPGELKPLALRGLLNGDFTNRAEATAMVQFIQQMLNDPQGPEPSETLRQVVERVGNNPDAVAALTTTISFGQLTEARLDDAIAYLITAAPRSPLAAAWLDAGLLGAFDQRVAKRTLELIVAADTGPSPARTLADLLTRLIATPPEGAATSEPRLKLAGLLPLRNDRNSLFNLFNSGDPETVELAWSALLAFTVNPPQPDPNTPGFNNQQMNDPQAATTAAAAISRVLTEAQKRPETPITLAPFLARQDTPRATEGLVQVCAEGSPAAAGQAATALLGSGRQIGPAITTLGDANRAAFGRQFYEQVTGEATPVVQLLRYPEPAVGQWFGAKIAAGQVPQANEWAQSLTEPTLIRLAGSSDVDLAAGAVATLVYAAGGDRFAADEQIQRFASLTDRSETSIAGAWASARKDIFTRRLSDAAGMYALVLNVYPPGTGPATATPQQAMYDPYSYGPPGFDPGPGGMPMPGADGYGMDPYGPYEPYGPPGAAPPPPQATGAASAQPTKHELATVELVADGTSVSFRNATIAVSVPADTYAIRLNNAGELKNFPVESIEKLDLQSITAPIDLVPQADGSWKGSGTMRDGSTVEVLLQPTDE